MNGNNVPHKVWSFQIQCHAFQFMNALVIFQHIMNDIFEKILNDSW